MLCIHTPFVDTEQLIGIGDPIDQLREIGKMIRNSGIRSDLQRQIRQFLYDCNRLSIVMKHAVFFRPRPPSQFSAAHMAYIQHISKSPQLMNYILRSALFPFSMALGVVLDLASLFLRNFRSAFNLKNRAACDSICSVNRPIFKFVPMRDPIVIHPLYIV